MTFPSFLSVAAVGLLLGATACSFSHSSQSLADSSKSSSDSSSGSSGESQAQLAEDLALYTEAFVEAGGRSDHFLGGVGDLATLYGVTDWESDPAAWQAIGRGLARSGLPQRSLAVYAENWTGGDSARLGLIAQGIAAGR